MNNFRETITKNLTDLFDSNPKIHTVWEGGSAATGYIDEYSDLDLALIADDDAIEEVFEQLENFLDEHYTVTSKFRMPEPSWHGHSQCFYFLKDVPELFYVDVLIEKLSAKNRLIEPDRHGEAQVWFDKKNLLNPIPTPEEAVIQKGKFMYNLTKDGFMVSMYEVKKNIRRKRPTDAMMFYGGLINRYLAVMLNLKYRHHKHDFGIRYAWRAYPEEWHKLLADLMYVKDFDDLEKKLEIVIEKFNELVEELKEQWG